MILSNDPSMFKIVETGYCSIKFNSSNLGVKFKSFQEILSFVCKYLTKNFKKN